MFNDTNAVDLRDLIEDLESRGLTSNHKKAVAAASAALDGYASLDHLHQQAGGLQAPHVDRTALERRLASGEDVPESELIEYAARATAAGTSIAQAARDVIAAAADRRFKEARDALRPAFPGLVEALAEYVADLADLTPRERDKITYNLRVIDKHAGRDVCDFWLVHHDRTKKWAILVSTEASRALDDNEAYAQERSQQNQVAVEKIRRIVPPKKQSDPRLRRRPIPSSSRSSDSGVSADDVAAYRAAKDDAYFRPSSTYTRAELAEGLTR